MSQRVKPGYKQTEVGVIPEDWECGKLEDYFSFISYGFTNPMPTVEHGIFMVTAADINEGRLQLETARKTTETAYRTLLSPKSKPKKNDILLTKDGSLGRLALVGDEQICINQSVAVIRPNNKAEPIFLKLLLESPRYQKRMLDEAGGSTIKHIYITIVNLMPIGLPRHPPEQRAIATALSDVDALLAALDRLIAKQRDLKQAAMQQLLTGQTRLPGFTGKWETKTLGEITDSLDNLRVPLNESQRERMKGDYPYCGANGVLGFVDNYVVDDDIILMAEDGGYFDEYETRPIAYRMTGKCWVNNHAHILKAKPGSDQGYLFYSLVHKNILPFLASGTRAKLNKSEMNKIEIRRPKDLPEQTTIATVLSDMDLELAALEQRRDKTRALKQGMMQELLTGRTRLIS